MLWPANYSVPWAAYCILLCLGAAHCCGRLMLIAIGTVSTCSLLWSANCSLLWSASCSLIWLANYAVLWYRPAHCYIRLTANCYGRSTPHCGGRLVTHCYVRLHPHCCGRLAAHWYVRMPVQCHVRVPALCYGGLSAQCAGSANFLVAMIGWLVIAISLSGHCYGWLSAHYCVRLTIAMDSHCYILHVQYSSSLL